MISPQTPWTLSIAAASVLGGGVSNDDRVYFDTNTVVVVDGAGGDANPGLTATAALSGVLSGLSTGDETGGIGAAELVRCAARAVDRLRSLRGAATVTVARIHAETRPRVELAWVGDSPAYLLREGALRQLSRPHNQAQELVEQRFLTFEEAPASPLAKVLTRGVGVIGGDPEEYGFELHQGDRLLVASDGIQVLTSQQIGRALSHGVDAQAAATALVGAALEVGPEDNVTVAVIVVGAPRFSAVSLLEPGSSEEPPTVPRPKGADLAGRSQPTAELPPLQGPPRAPSREGTHRD